MFQCQVEGEWTSFSRIKTRLPSPDRCLYIRSVWAKRDAAITGSMQSRCEMLYNQILFLLLLILFVYIYIFSILSFYLTLSLYPFLFSLVYLFIFFGILFFFLSFFLLPWWRVCDALCMITFLRQSFDLRGIVGLWDNRVSHMFIANTACSVLWYRDEPAMNASRCQLYFNICTVNTTLKKNITVVIMIWYSVTSMITAYP